MSSAKEPIKDMSAKKRATSSNAIQQAELILHLYELRRETVMREARSYVGGEFLPPPQPSFSTSSVGAANTAHSFFRSMDTGTWLPHL